MPELEIVAVTVATMSKREEEPPGMVVPDSAPEVARGVVVMLRFV